MIPRIIKIQHCPNPHFLVFHTTLEISEDIHQHFMRPIRESSLTYLNKVGEIGTRIITQTLALDGVIEAHIQPYKLSVEKGEAFDWRDIEPGVVEILKKEFGEEAPEIIGSTCPPAPVASTKEGTPETVETISSLTPADYTGKSPSTEKLFQRFLGMVSLERVKKLFNKLLKK